MSEVQDSKPSHSTNDAVIKASHIPEPKLRTGKILSASLMGGTAKSHAKDTDQRGVKNWGFEGKQQAAGGTDTFPTLCL